MLTAEGTNTAAAAMLFMMVDSPAAESISTAVRRPGFGPTAPSTRWPIHRVTPVRSRPWLRMNIARIVMTADWLNPERV